jgi:predicted MFS family arabinose efflux permease
VGLRVVLAPTAPGAPVPLAERLAVARRPDVLGVLASTTLVMAGVFAVYTYLAPFLGAAAGLDGQAVALVLFFFGMGSATGNLLGGAASDRFGPRRVLGVVLTALVGVFSLLSLVAHTLPPSTARFAIVALVALWGLAGFAFPAAQQSRLVRLDPRLAPITLSLNGSAIYGGVSLGAVIGSLVVRSGHLTSIGWVAALCELAALAVVQLAGQPRPVVSAAPAARTAA